jgi:carbon-monoxide dehydrogenase large subunit
MPEIPEIEELFANAPHVISRTFGGARATNVPMEPRGLTVHYDRYRDELLIRAATQSVHEIKAFASRFKAPVALFRKDPLPPATTHRP